MLRASYAAFPDTSLSFCIQWAGSAKWQQGDTRLEWLSRSGFGIAFSPDPEHLFSLRKWLNPYVDRAVPIRLHAFFPGFEIGANHADHANRAMEIHFRLIEIAARLVEDPVITCHIGLTPKVPIDPSRSMDNLGRLVKKAMPLGVTIALENLKTGPTADPGTFFSWTRESGAGITLDIGHALSSAAVQNQKIGIHELIDRSAPYLTEVHYYEKETDRHHRPEDMRTLGPVVDHLLATGCRWWTIELEAPADMLHTRNITQDYLAAQAAETLLKQTG